MANSVILTGNITRDFEVRYIPDSQTAVATTSIAVKRPFTKDKTDFIPIVVYGKQAENCQKFLHKGSKILVEGSIIVDSYEKDGEKKSFTKVNCSKVEFLDKAEKKDDSESQVPDGFQAVDDSDIPF